MSLKPSLVSSSSVVVEGWLLKEGARVKNWKRRWFVLDSRHVLRYFKKQSAKKAAGVIDMTACSGVICAAKCDCDWPHNIDNKLAFGIVTPTRVYHIYGESEAELKEWLKAFQKAARITSALPLGAPIVDGTTKETTKALADAHAERARRMSMTTASSKQPSLASLNRRMTVGTASGVRKNAAKQHHALEAVSEAAVAVKGLHVRDDDGDDGGDFYDDDDSDVSDDDDDSADGEKQRLPTTSGISASTMLPSSQGREEKHAATNNTANNERDDFYTDSSDEADEGDAEDGKGVQEEEEEEENEKREEVQQKDKEVNVVQVGHAHSEDAGNAATQCHTQEPTAPSVDGEHDERTHRRSRPRPASTDAGDGKQHRSSVAMRPAPAPPSGVQKHAGKSDASDGSAIGAENVHVQGEVPHANQQPIPKPRLPRCNTAVNRECHRSSAEEGDGMPEKARDHGDSEHVHSTVKEGGTTSREVVRDEEAEKKLAQDLEGLQKDMNTESTVSARKRLKNLFNIRDFSDDEDDDGGDEGEESRGDVSSTASVQKRSASVTNRRDAATRREDTTVASMTEEQLLRTLQLEAQKVLLQETAATQQQSDGDGDGDGDGVDYRKQLEEMLLNQREEGDDRAAEVGTAPKAATNNTAADDSDTDFFSDSD